MRETGSPFLYAMQSVLAILVVSAFGVGSAALAQNTGKILLGDMVGLEAQQRFSDDTLFILPFGDIEFHGPAAPFGTDNYNVGELAERVARRVDSVLLLPIMPFGITPPEIMRHAGSLTLKEDTFKAVARELLESLISHKARKFLVINGHGGNTKPLKEVCAEIEKTHTDLFLKCTFWIEYAPDKDLKDLFTVSPAGHGAAREVASALVSRPGVVDLKTIDFSNFPGRDTIWHGKPEEASKEKGEKIFELAVRNIVTMLKQNGIKVKGY
ncbi:MAG: creatininase family protein [Acidobacteria bacterium]|nr:creatininase family protein [Acidobacteriota bacterium]